ncbi:MAG: type III-A CRISPR-associated protein Csm2 [Sphingomonadales bacterium]|nr:MAG: type III-A CRISPR-associated protein Csm2 [Sphingomonadales bacterium]
MATHGRHDNAGRDSRQHPPRGSNAPDTEFLSLLQRINLREPDADAFDVCAERIAKKLSETAQKDTNKSSQLRRFYNEVIRHYDACRGVDVDAVFSQRLPFIRMLSAQAKYAENRKKVDSNFTAFMQTNLRKIENARDLHNFRTLFEAVIGFMPKSE